MDNEHPRVFISYSWDDEEHKDWVREFTKYLINKGIDATLDQYDLSLGDRLPQFMEKAITDSDYVLIICTPIYKVKSDSRIGGVGYEGHIISAELLSKGNERKFIPIIRKGTAETAMPICLAGKLRIDLSDEKDYIDNFKDLITTIFGARKKPMLGKMPEYVFSTENSQSIDNPSDPIHILGIITDEVTVPRLDGTRGSALYSIPFRLSKRPSDLWHNLFVMAWNDPPRFTTMHRPGIASVFGDRIILDGTTIEEVRDVHRKTLMLCIDVANKEEARILEKQRQHEIMENKRKIEYYSKINDVADEIEF